MELKGRKDTGMNGVNGNRIKKKKRKCELSRKNEMAYNEERKR